MPERTKPPTPSIDDLKNERRKESVTLVNKVEMLERLRSLYAPGNDTLQNAEQVLFPHLLAYAGVSMSVSQIPMIIVQAVVDARGISGRNLRGEMAAYARLVEAMIDGEEQRDRAKKLLIDSLNG